MPIKIKIGATELYDEATSKYVKRGGTEVMLEHSLVSLSKWESEWETPFLGDKEKTQEQVLDYVKCMYVGDEFPPDLFAELSDSNVMAINGYIESKQTATTVYDMEDPSARGGKKQIITSELIYSWMVQYRIPFETQNWHLARLLTLIRVLNEQNRDKNDKKLTKGQIAERNRRLNAQRRQQYGTKG